MASSAVAGDDGGSDVFSESCVGLLSCLRTSPKPNSLLAELGIKLKNVKTKDRPTNIFSGLEKNLVSIGNTSQSWVSAVCVSNGQSLEVR